MIDGVVVMFVSIPQLCSQCHFTFKWLLSATCRVALSDVTYPRGFISRNRPFMTFVSSIKRLIVCLNPITWDGKQSYLFFTIPRASFRKNKLCPPRYDRPLQSRLIPPGSILISYLRPFVGTTATDSDLLCCHPWINVYFISGSMSNIA